MAHILRYLRKYTTDCPPTIERRVCITRVVRVYDGGGRAEVPKETEEVLLVCIPGLSIRTNMEDILNHGALLSVCAAGEALEFGQTFETYGIDIETLIDVKILEFPHPEGQQHSKARPPRL